MTRVACRGKVCYMPHRTGVAVICAGIWSAWKCLACPKLIDRFQVQGKSSFVILHQNISAAINSLVVCKFTNMGVAEEYFARVLSAVTGIHYATGDLIKSVSVFGIWKGFTTCEKALPARMIYFRLAYFRRPRSTVPQRGGLCISSQC